VEAARANNRQGLPVGAAYLSQASTLMRAQILPAADRLYKAEADRLDSSYRAGTSPVGLVALIVIAAALLLALVLTQIFVARRTNRLLNLPLVAATALVLGLTIWIVAGFVIEQNRLNGARSHGSNAVQVLSQARALALRAQADESLSLVARGSGAQYVSDFDVTKNALGGDHGTTGALGLAAALPEPPQAAGALESARTAYGDYLNLHSQITAQSETNFDNAVKLAIGPAVNDFTTLDNQLNTAISANQQEFEAGARHARHVLGPADVGIPFFIVVAGVLAMLGLQQRINEYR
jgi:hypothetical protein